MCDDDGGDEVDDATDVVTFEIKFICTKKNIYYLLRWNSRARLELNADIYFFYGKKLFLNNWKYYHYRQKMRGCQFTIRNTSEIRESICQPGATRPYHSNAYQAAVIEIKKNPY